MSKPHSMNHSMNEVYQSTPNKKPYSSKALVLQLTRDGGGIGSAVISRWQPSPKIGRF